MKWFQNLGPGFLVTAAFIGPGTVTTASKAGAEFGFALMWAVVFSVFATIVLQEMSARLGLITGEGLGESMRTTFRNPVLRTLTIGLVVAAIALGNAAFQTGNIVGAAGGLQSLVGGTQQVWVIVVGLGAFVLLACGGYKLLERALMLLVVLMSVVFVVTAIIVRPDISNVFAGMVPRVSGDTLLTIVALIGTTVVPYNLFLHSSAVREHWPQSVPVAEALKAARRDAAVSISLGGVITLAVMSTAVAAFFGTSTTFESLGGMAGQLEPLFGGAAKSFFAVGLLAAGLTSAITAPLAAAYATAGVLGWKRDLADWRLRLVWAVIVVVGTTFAALATSPVAAIVFAQAANGILLPFIAVFLLVVMNRRDLLGEHTNGAAANLFGVLVVLTAAGFGVFQLVKVMGGIS